MVLICKSAPHFWPRNLSEAKLLSSINWLEYLRLLQRPIEWWQALWVNVDVPAFKLDLHSGLLSVKDAQSWCQANQVSLLLMRFYLTAESYCFELLTFTALTSASWTWNSPLSIHCWHSLNFAVYLAPHHLSILGCFWGQKREERMRSSPVDIFHVFMKNSTSSHEVLSVKKIDIFQDKS